MTDLIQVFDAAPPRASCARAASVAGPTARPVRVLLIGAYELGRQPFGLAFHPDNGELFSVDVGKGEFCNFCTEDNAPP